MRRFLLLAALLSLASTRALGQTPGSLNDAFGDHGHVLADLSAENRFDEYAIKVLIQPDGKRVAVVDRYPYLHLIRFNPDGSYDATFGQGGFSQAAPLRHFGGPNSCAAIQSDGKVVVVGETEWNQTNMTDFGVARWNTDGTLDASFGTQGIVTTDFGGYWEEANLVKVQPDGKILVAGRVDINSTPLIGLTRYNSDGSLDGTFGAGGKYLNVSDMELSDMGLMPDGKLMVLGDPVGGSGNFALIRYNANGFIDTSFGIQGYEVYDWTLNGQEPRVQCLEVQPDGKILLGGSIYNGVNSDMLVVRYDADGVIDNGFHGDGKQTTHIGGYEDVNDIVVQPDGKIVVAGDVFYTSDLPTRFALARYTAAGDLDGTFGVQGTQLTTFGDYEGSSALGVALHPDGDITAAGIARRNYSGDVAIATYDVQGVGDVDGYAVQRIAAYYANSGATRFLASAVQTDGKLVTAGYVWNGLDYDFLLARFDVDGTLDQSFGAGGYQKTDFPQEGSGDEGAWSLAIQPDGRIIASGTFFNFTVGGSLPVARYLSNGTLDPSFGAGGIVQIQGPGIFEDGNAIVVQADGKILIGGSVDQADFNFCVWRLNDDGSLDATWGGTGAVTTNFGYQDIIFGLALQPDGKLLATGNTSLPNSFEGFDFCTVRYNTDGSLDAGFGTNGRVTTDFGDIFDFAEAIALQPDGKIVVAGSAPINDDYQYAVARYTAAGAPDLTFGNGGVETIGFLGYDGATAVALQSDGKVLLAGFTEGGNLAPSPVDIALARYGPTGVLDAQFGNQGKVVSDFDDQEWAFAMSLLNRKIYASGIKRELNSFTRADKFLGIVANYWTGPPPADEQASDLIGDIAGLPGVPAGTKQSLSTKLQAALTALAARDTAGACNNLRAFMNEVKALASKKKLTEAQATQLLADAQAIMDELGCTKGSQLAGDVPNTGVGTPLSVPTKFALQRNWPNPFRASTHFAYQLPVASKVSLQVYNVLGQVVATVVDEVQGPGWKTARWDATGLASGVYYYKLTAGDFSETHKILLVR